ncbi:HTH_48 domain-containing protein [Trichonephila clavipes]|nr:HTH_48 domain-containing protein [Trichonephila clavipes]
MEVTRVYQRTYIKISVLRGRNAMEFRSELVNALGNNALPYRTVAWWLGKFQQGRVSTCDEQHSGRFTHGAANAEADGIQRLPHRWQCVVTVAGDYFECFMVQFCHVNFMCTVLSLFCTMKAILPCILRYFSAIHYPDM